MTQRDWRVLTRSRSLAYLLLTGLVVPSVVLSVGLWYGANHRWKVSPELVRDTAVISHFIMLLLASAGWTLGMLAREVQTGRMEELLVAGCRPRELMGSIILGALMVMILTSFAGLPLIILAISLTNTPAMQGFAVAVAEVASALLFLTVGLALQGANNSLTINRKTIRQILFHAFWFFTLLGVSLHLLAGKSMPTLFRLISSLSPLEAVLSTVRPDDPRWQLSMPVFFLVSWLVANRLVLQTNRFVEDSETLLDPNLRMGQSLKAITMIPGAFRETTRFLNQIPILKNNIVFRQDRFQILKIPLIPLIYLLVLLGLAILVFPVQYALHPRYVLSIMIGHIAIYDLVIASAVSFHRDAAGNRFPFLILTRLSYAEILIGKIAAVYQQAFWLCLAAGLLLEYTLSGFSIQPRSTGIIITAFYSYSFTLSLFAGMAGTRCRSVDEAALVSIWVTTILSILTLAGVQTGIYWAGILNPLVALLTINPTIIRFCMLLQVFVAAVSFFLASRYLDRVVLRQ